MSYGPVRMDFTPLGQIGSSFFDARDKAIDHQFKMAQLTSPSEIASIMAQNAGQGSAAPPANNQPGMTPIGSLGQTAKPQTFDPSAIPSFVTAAAGPAGVSPDYMAKTAWIESKGNPNAFNKGSGAAGTFQFIPSTWKQYGGDGSPFDPQASAMAMATLTAGNKAALQKSLGRDPTDAELYLAHQQGAGGATALLANPNVPAVQALAGIYAKSGAKDPYATAIKAVVGNGGRPDMTAGDFAGLWMSKYNSLTPAGGSPVGSSPQVAQAMGQRTMTMPGQGPQTAQAAPSIPMSAGGQGGPAMTMPAGTQTVANPFQTSQTPPADEPAPGAQPTQFVIPGQGGSPAQSQAPAPYQVTAPQIPVPPYIKALAASPNPYVRAKATELYLQYQQTQQQMAVKAWELSQTFTHDDQKQTRDFDYHRPFDEAKAGAAQTSAAAAQTNAQTNQGKLKETIAQNTAGNALRNREVTTQEAGQQLKERAQSFDEGLKIKGPVNDKITEVLNQGLSQAKGASDTLKDLARQEADLNSGMFTGAGANAKQAAAQYLTRLFPSLNQAVSSGQDYQAAVQREVGSLARQLAQTGHTTNMDINVSKMISAADPTYTEQAIREIIRQNRQRALDTIQRQNNTVDQAAKANRGASDQYEFFRVQPPEEANGPPPSKGAVGGTSPSGIKWKLK